MCKYLYTCICFTCLWVTIASGQNITDTKNINQWNKLQMEPITENRFRTACDLMQSIAKTDINLSYTLFTKYLPRIQATGNRRWIHILLMSWGRAEESLNYYTKAEALYRQARANAAGDPQFFRESLGGTILLYLEWGKNDSLKKYIPLSLERCRMANDSENLSFTYTFKAMALQQNRDSMKYYLTRAIELAKNLADKNALFTARYNYAVVYCQNNPAREVDILEALIPLAKDSSLNHYPPKLYERTNFSFRNATSSIYYNLMQVSLLLTDYNNAEKYAWLFYNTTISPNPDGVQAPYFNAEMAIVEAYKNNYSEANTFLEKSRKGFHVAQDKIPYISYFIAAGLLAEHQKKYNQALQDYKTALNKGNTQGLYLMPPEIYYAHALTLTKNWQKAEQVFNKIGLELKENKFTATGFYYYKYYADLLKAQKRYPAYVKALNAYYHIKDSLISLSRYRVIKEVETRFQVKEDQQQIKRLHEQQVARAAASRREQVFYITFISLAILVIVLLIFNLRHRLLQIKQKEALQQSKIKQMEEQHRIEVMKGVMEAEEKERYSIQTNYTMK